MSFHLYSPKGATLAERQIALPDYQKIRGIENPDRYIASVPLSDAVNVALALGQPLLLTGEPGTGKTQLANSIAYQLGLPLYKFFTKSDATAKDLFYRYDSLRHFHDAQLKSNQDLSAENYIDLEALGKAIVNSTQQRAVVLIDEIDKAPRDFPNDVLNEMEQMEFQIKETGKRFQADEANRPIVVITSNSEKNLPDAFLRRCVFFHIPFPGKALLKEIVNSRLELTKFFKEQMLDAAIDHFKEIRNNRGLRKKPATAELLAWIHILDELDIDITQPELEKEQLRMSYTILAKSADDLKKLMG